MTRASSLLASALLASLSLAVLAVPGAAALSCATTNPFPASPVGGEVGRQYTFATGTTYGVFAFGVHTGCAVVGQAVSTVNAACVFLLGSECIDIA